MKKKHKGVRSIGLFLDQNNNKCKPLDKREGQKDQYQSMNAMVLLILIPSTVGTNQQQSQAKTKKSKQLQSANFFFNSKYFFQQTTTSWVH